MATSQFRARAAAGFSGLLGPCWALLRLHWLGRPLSEQTSSLSLCYCRWFLLLWHPLGRSPCPLMSPLHCLDEHQAPLRTSTSLIRRDKPLIKKKKKTTSRAQLTPKLKTSVSHLLNLLCGTLPHTPCRCYSR